MSEFGEKTQDATPHRRQQAREKGQVAQSQDLGSAVLLMAAVLILMGLGPAVANFMAELIQKQIGGDAWLDSDRDFLLRQGRDSLVGIAEVMLPILGLLMLVGLAVNLSQVGFLFVPERLKPDVTRIDPLKGLRRLFSLASAVRLGLGMFKVIVVTSVALWSLYDHQGQIMALAELEAPQIALFIVDITLWTCLKIGAALLILAMLDFAYQRWKHEQDLRMTTQEVREEMKNLQGDPQIIARRRAVQRQLALNRLGELVPKADVVITNPTELAIAIQYKPDEMAAPIVLAKGAGVIAGRIRQLATESSVPIVENKPLARRLYKEVEPQHPIPSDLYAAVAEVLAYVYQLQGKELPKPPSQ